MSDFNRIRACGCSSCSDSGYSSSERVICCDRCPVHNCGCGSSSGCERPEPPTLPNPGPDCGCGGNGNGSGNGNGNNNENGCTCCKESMRNALKLFCSNEVSDLVDFDAFAFLTDSNVVGAELNNIPCECRDNLGPLTATFRRFSPCNCDLIDISGNVSGTCVEVDQASLCALSAIAFQLRPAQSDDCCCSAETDEQRYRRLRDLLQAELENTDRPCGQCVCHCDCTDDCCCTTGVLTALSDTTLNKRTTLVAGLLILRDATALGTIGNVLVLGNECRGRFYFVCANKVEFLA